MGRFWLRLRRIKGKTDHNPKPNREMRIGDRVIFAKI